MRYVWGHWNRWDESSGDTRAKRSTYDDGKNTSANRGNTCAKLCSFMSVATSLDAECVSGREECYNAGNMFSPDRCHGNKEVRPCMWMNSCSIACEVQMLTEVSDQHVEHSKTKLRIEIDSHLLFDWWVDLREQSISSILRTYKELFAE